MYFTWISHYTGCPGKRYTKLYAYVLLPKSFMKFVFSTVYRVTQKRLLCTSVHLSVGTWFETTYHWSSWAYNTSHADKHVARAWISFRYLSSYNRGPHWSVRTCIKIFLGYSVHCWKHKFHNRISVGANFFAHVQTGHAAHPARCTIGMGSFPGGKAAGAWCWPPAPS
jgi:hypothetical protein